MREVPALFRYLCLTKFTLRLSMSMYWGKSFLLVPGSMGCCFLIDTTTWKYKRIQLKGRNYEVDIIH